MVADSGYTTRENIEKLAGREIDFLGIMRYENVPRGANLPNRFPPSAFPYLPEKNHCVWLTRVAVLLVQFWNCPSTDVSSSRSVK
jgi:hypothetical protein